MSKTDIFKDSTVRMLLKALIICLVISVLTICKVDPSVILFVLDYLLTSLLSTAQTLGSLLTNTLGLVLM